MHLGIEDKESYNCMNNCLCFHLLLLALKELLMQQNPAFLLEAKYEIVLSLDIRKIYVPSGSCSEFCSSTSLVSHHLYPMEIS